MRVFDNFSTGNRANLAFAKGHRNLEIVRGELAKREGGGEGRARRDGRLPPGGHALGSALRRRPLGANASNVTGTLHVFVAAARQKKKPRVVYASSSSVYGERPELPKREDQPTAPISPYAASKVAGELYGSVWSRLFDVETVGLRYFNVFGPGQDPKSEYAAVIPASSCGACSGKPLQRAQRRNPVARLHLHRQCRVRQPARGGAPRPPSRARPTTWAAAAARACSTSSSRSSASSGALWSASTRRPGWATCRTPWPTSARPSATWATEPIVDFAEGLRRTVAYFTEGHDDDAARLGPGAPGSPRRGGARSVSPAGPRATSPCRCPRSRPASTSRPALPPPSPPSSHYNVQECLVKVDKQRQARAVAGRPLVHHGQQELHVLPQEGRALPQRPRAPGRRRQVRPGAGGQSRDQASLPEALRDHPRDHRQGRLHGEHRPQGGQRQLPPRDGAPGLGRSIRAKRWTPSRARPWARGRSRWPTGCRATGWSSRRTRTITSRVCPISTRSPSASSPIPTPRWPP